MGRICLSVRGAMGPKSPELRVQWYNNPHDPLNLIRVIPAKGGTVIQSIVPLFVCLTAWAFFVVGDLEVDCKSPGC